MTEFQKIAESEHRVLIGLTILLIVILILVILSSISITKTMKQKDRTIKQLENKIHRIIPEEK